MFSVDDYLRHIGAPLHWVDYSEDDGVSVVHDEGRVLAGLAFTLGGTVVEIGSYRGISTRYIHAGLTERGDGGRVIAVDPAHKWRPKKEEWPLITQVDNRAMEAFLPPAKWVFIDAVHDFLDVVVDIKLAQRTGADVLVFHDTAPHLPTQKNMSYARSAAQSVLKAPWRLEDVETLNGIMVARR